MSWLLFAFSGPLLWAISVHFDKYLVEQYFKDSHVAVLLIFTALAGLLLLPFIWAYEPGVTDLPTKSVLLMALSGILYMTALFFYLRALQVEEASVVVPFSQASPLFGYVLGYVFLGEILSPAQLLGGVLIMTGASLVALKIGSRAREFRGRVVMLMLACAFSIALSSLIFKIFAIHEDFWPTTFWMLVGQAIFGAGLLAIAPYRRQFFKMLRSNTGALLAINGANELINLGGSLGNRYALLLAPLSLVQAIGGTTSILVYALGAALSLFFPSIGREDLSRANLVQKGLSAVLVGLGVILVSSSTPPR